MSGGGIAAVTAEAFSKVFAHTTSRDVAAMAGTTQRSVNRARQAGHVPRGRRGEAMARAMEALCDGRVTVAEIMRRDGPAAPPAAPPAAAPGPAVSEVDIQVIRSTRVEDMRTKRLKREQLEAQLAQELGKLVPVDEIRARHQAAGVEFQRGFEVVRRDVESRCSPDCRGAVVAALDEGYQALRERIGRALGGEDAEQQRAG